MLLSHKQCSYQFVNEYFHFQNPTNDQLAIYRNSFVSLGFVLFRPWARTSASPIQDAPLERGGLLLGYLVNRNSNYFSKDTWRLSTRIKINRRINIESELYWNGVFKNVYPGLRINVAFFTNE